VKCWATTQSLIEKQADQDRLAGRRHLCGSPREPKLSGGVSNIDLRGRFDSHAVSPIRKPMGGLDLGLNNYGAE
jgi:hypothetical protein